MIILVTGSREFGSYDAVAWGLVHARKAFLSSEWETIVLRHGACSRKDPDTGDELSADMLADLFVRKSMRGEWKIQARPADWDTHGKAAGFLRNQAMLDEELPDVCVAFLRKDLPCRGTRDMMERCYRVGVPVLAVSR